MTARDPIPDPSEHGGTWTPARLDPAAVGFGLLTLIGWGLVLGAVAGWIGGGPTP